MLFKAELEDGSEILREDLTSFNFAIKDKKVKSIVMDDSDNLALVNLVDGSIYCNDFEDEGNIDLQISDNDLSSCLSYGLTPIVFRRVTITKGESDSDNSQTETYFVGWKSILNNVEVVRLVHLNSSDVFELGVRK
jgi:hypothetical protein